MPKSKSRDACELGIAFIDAQLLTLYTHASLLADWIEKGEKTPDPSAAQRLFTVKRAHPERHAHSEDGTPTKSAPPALSLSWPEFGDASQRMAFALRVPNTNAIIAVADFFEVHQMSSSRTPEVQFLMRLRDAALNDNTFRISTDEYLPHAAYGGLIVDEKLNGTLLLGDGVKPGFMELGDTVGLLRYLANLLRSMQTVISAGDAG
ncbi:hypothetical protein BGLT_01683 [Caballeronia glathei]|jgi:hypothetical protein|uniref:Uncharacterized protein n=2 Tax=Caballeronia glathei TaxID=60547 RepID=A0A069PQA9_9BURK|nr:MULTISPECIES: hypothetical protein [Burkholderiaceae]KDR42790.1 hypothetical protein BG61_06500 [Caballeronia glathei]TCK37047.1 hypothetical protein B0G84_6082 [Paraburkholderia sp. BL8N3]CDY78990.1 hypothetical protein BGLT_01683 [Caballeronia glathei]